MSDKTFGFGQRVTYDGYKGVSIVTGKALTDPSGNETDDWWWVATPDLPSILTHAKNIDPVIQTTTALGDDELEAILQSMMRETSPFGTVLVSMSDRQKDIVRIVLKHVRVKYNVMNRQ